MAQGTPEWPVARDCCNPQRFADYERFAARAAAVRFFMSDKTVILTAAATHRVLTRIAHEIAERNEHSPGVAVVGVQRGGVPPAQRLWRTLAGIWGHDVSVGTLDVSMHRDDVGQQIAPAVHPTEIPFDINGRSEERVSRNAETGI